MRCTDHRANGCRHFPGLGLGKPTAAPVFRWWVGSDGVRQAISERQDGSDGIRIDLVRMFRIFLLWIGGRRNREISSLLNREDGRRS